MGSRLPWLILFTLWQTLAASSFAHMHSRSMCSRSKHDEPLSAWQGTEICPLSTDWSKAPWSHRPVCPDPKGNDDEQTPGDCVFTLDTFRGQGITLITTVDLAASVADYLDDSSVLPRLRGGLLSWGQKQRGTHEAYEIKNIPGRGKGVVAKRRIRKHELVTVDFPVFVVRLDFINGDSYTARQRRVMMETGLNQLPAEQKKAIMGLARSTGGEPMIDILRTNGFGVEIEGVQHLALLIDGSRVNHNCRPNAFWRYAESNMAMEVLALREISVGEEIAHSYAPLGYTYEERKAVLQGWGFRCRCALCSAPPAEREVSDSLRQRLLEIHRTLGQAAGLSRQRIGELVPEALGIIKREELEPQLVEYYQQFAKAYMAVGDLKRAREYVALADEMWLLYGGEEHENIQGMRELWALLEEAERLAEDD